MGVSVCPILRDLNTYVMRAAFKAWKMKPRVAKKPLKYEPMREQSANRPVNKAHVVKKRAMSMKANMNLVIK